MLRRIVIALACLLPCLAPVNSAESDAERLVSDVAATYRHFNSYTIEYLDIYGNAAEYRRKISFLRPDRYRVEESEPVAGIIDIYDGTTAWTWAPELRQYTSSRQERDMHPAFEVYRVERLDTHMKGADFLPGETLDIAGRKYECTVVRVLVEPGSYVKIWLDKERKLVLRYLAETARTRVSLTALSAEINPPLAPGLFTFNPPEGAMKVTEICCWDAAGHPSQRAR